MILTFKLVKNADDSTVSQSGRLKDVYVVGKSLDKPALYSIEEHEGEDNLVDCCNLEYLLKNFTEL